MESRLGQGWPGDLKLKKDSVHFQIVLIFCDCVISPFHPKAKRVKSDACSHFTRIVFGRKQRKWRKRYIHEWSSQGKGSPGRYAQKKVFGSGEKSWTPFPTVQFRDSSACPSVTLGWVISSENSVEISSRWWEDWGSQDIDMLSIKDLLNKCESKISEKMTYYFHHY